MSRLLSALLFLLLTAGTASTQTTVRPCVTVAGGQCQAVTATNPLPTSSTFTPSGTQDVNIAQVLGAAPSLTNPLFVSPATGASFSAVVAGDVASGATDSGNPVKTGGTYFSSRPTFTNGQRGNLQIGTRGSLNVTLCGEDAASCAAVTGGGNDGTTNTFNAQNVSSYGKLWNGSTWDRVPGTTAGAYVAGAVASAATDSGNPVKVGGVYTATAPAFTDGQRANAQVDTTGSKYINSEGRKTTYRASTSVVIAATATDIFTIFGSGTKIVRVTYIRYRAYSTAGGIKTVALIKRSTADTGGTAVALTAIPLDSANAAATAVVNSYTANPTLGSTVGNISTIVLGQAAVTTVTPIDNVEWRFGVQNGQAGVLRGTGQGFVINLLGAATQSGENGYFEVEWTEE